MNDFNNKILSKLPYSRPFLFVDTILDVSDNYIIGEYTYRPDEFFYKGHFKNNPVTPGVIILETMGQIGLVSYALYLNNFELVNDPLLSYLESEFFEIVKPGDKVFVKGEKVYLRNNTLKCRITMHNKDDILVATLNAILKLN